MGRAIGKLLLQAVAVALSVVPVVAVIFLLFLLRFGLLGGLENPGRSFQTRKRLLVPSPWARCNQPNSLVWKSPPDPSLVISVMEEPVGKSPDLHDRSSA